MLGVQRAAGAGRSATSQEGTPESSGFQSSRGHSLHARPERSRLAAACGSGAGAHAVTGCLASSRAASESTYVSGWMEFSGDSSWPSVVTPAWRGGSTAGCIGCVGSHFQGGAAACREMCALKIGRGDAGWTSAPEPKLDGLQHRGAGSATLCNGGGRALCRLGARLARTRQAQHGGQAAVLAEQDVGVQAIAHHADLQTQELQNH